MIEYIVHNLLLSISASSGSAINFLIVMKIFLVNGAVNTLAEADSVISSIIVVIIISFSSFVGNRLSLQTNRKNKSFENTN